MNTEALKHLRDIHTPKAIGFWPPAPGWILLLLLLILSIAAISAWLYIRHQKQKPKRAALKELENIKATYLMEKNSPKTATALNELLKRYCLTLYSRKKIASLYGESWQLFLGNKDWCQKLALLGYQKQSDEDLGPLFDDIAKWLVEGKHDV